MNRPHAVILAAGVGRRLVSESGGTPKCLLRFDGLSLLERQLQMLDAAGAARVTVVIDHQAGQVKQSLAAMAAELAALCSRYERAGDIDAPHEQALRELMLAHPRDFGYTDVTGLPWIEIDFPEDLQRARREVLPRLHKLMEAS